MSTEALPAFVARRRPDWERLTALLDGLDARRLRAAELTELDRCYRRAAADLARLQSFYAGTDAHRFLNQLCGRAYGRIYARPPDRLAALRRFFARDFPQTLRDELAFVGAAAGLVALGVAVGFSTLWVQPHLAGLFVPDAIQRYVAEHRLWTDSLELPPSQIATQILTNNLQVAVAAFALGLTFGLGTVIVLLNNGVFLGATLAHCFNGGVGKGLLIFMSAHGVVELSVIFICGGAGLMLGQALVVARERPRSEVLRERAGRAVRLVLGCAPFLAAIGVVEGFVSPGHRVPALLKVLLGACLGAGFWLYLLRAGRGQPGER
ncbi:MAG: stage II sporulation protein M [Archangiaceae bacterium]|nr:stage II sporulation protein M [Archangiaceae bacterium]